MEVKARKCWANRGGKWKTSEETIIEIWQNVELYKASDGTISNTVICGNMWQQMYLIFLDRGKIISRHNVENNQLDLLGTCDKIQGKRG